MSIDYLSGRGRTYCRGCDSAEIVSVLDLGHQPIANELGDFASERKKTYPLELSSCLQCGLGQIGEILLPDQIFNNYPYLSSMSSGWLAHAKSFASSSKKSLGLNQDNWVLEIASNDGYLLRYFNDLGVKTLGIEPADNVANIAREKGIETLSTFFGHELAKEIKRSNGFPKLIVANNVMAHVPDLEDFIQGLSEVCSDETFISIENPTMLNLIVSGQFDTIYHEHFSYLSAHSVSLIVQRFGLELLDVEKLPTHGGSNRYWIGRAGKHSPKSDLGEMISVEIENGLLDLDAHKRFRLEVQKNLEEFSEWISLSSSRRIIGYGAAAKGATFLNAAKVDRNQIAAVLDASPEKQNKFMPGSQIPILPMNAIQELDPTDILVLPWNIINEVKIWISGQLGEKSKIWTAVPRMRQH